MAADRYTRRPWPHTLSFLCSPALRTPGHQIPPCYWGDRLPWGPGMRLSQSPSRENLKGSLEAWVQVPALPPMTCPTFASAMTPEPQFTRKTETSLMGGYENEMK